MSRRIRQRIAQRTERKARDLHARRRRTRAADRGWAMAGLADRLAQSSGVVSRIPAVPWTPDQLEQLRAYRPVID
jgi:ribosome-binding protein aMBF1 (putative translation factor)